MTIAISTNALNSTGPMSFSMIRTLGDDTNPTGIVTISQFYRGGSIIPEAPSNVGVPTEGPLTLSGFRNCTSKVIATITGVEQALITSGVFGLYYGTGIPKTVKIQGTIISQSQSPALTVDSGSPTQVTLEFNGGTINGHRGEVGNGSVGPMAYWTGSNGIPVPTYQNWQQTGTRQNCQPAGGRAGTICFPVANFGYVTQNYPYTTSGSGPVSGGSGSGGTVIWYHWTQNNRVSWELGNSGISYVAGQSVSWNTTAPAVAGGWYGYIGGPSNGTGGYPLSGQSINQTFSQSFSCVTGGQGGGGNSGSGVPGNLGRIALKVNTGATAKLTVANGQTGAIRGGGGSGGGGGGGGQEGGGGRNNRNFCCGWFCPQCSSCDGGVGGGGDTGGPGGSGGQGRGYSWDGVNLVLQGPNSGNGGTNYGGGGGTGGTGGSGGGWGTAGGAGSNGSTGNQGPGGNCQGGGGGSAGGPGGSEGSAGISISGLANIPNGIPAELTTAGPTQN